MDWTKAKTILITALIITNIILGISVLIQKSKNQIIHADVIDETIYFLEGRNIFIYSKIPEKMMKMSVLEVEYDHHPVKVINHLTDQEVDVYKKDLTQDEAIDLTNDFLNRNGLMNENVKLENIIIEDNGYSITYKNYYQDILLEDCYMIFKVINGKITFIDRLWFNPISLGENKKATIPATTALLKFASLKENMNEEIIVTDIKLVYWLEDNSLFSMENTTLDTALPAWKITFNNGQKKYINAYEN